MVATAGVRASGAYVTSLTGTSNAVQASQAFVRVLYNIPTTGVLASSAYVTTLMQTSNEVRSSAAYVTVLWRGRVAQPQLRAWTYTMDGRLRGAPRTECLANFDKSRHGLKPVRVEIFASFDWNRKADGLNWEIFRASKVSSSW